ncbi:MAG: hypothetical protein JW716_00390 [Candidatus Aenigmarchaeota archaeon]|nr:hypothetical protein [Candidatus Aenigmarchaeota archaeon]
MGGITLDRKEFEDRNYILSSTKAFMQRYADTGHKTKWCGFWSPPLKFIDYYSYKISSDGREFWLGWDNCESFRLSKWGATHYFADSELSIEESVFIPIASRTMVSVIRFENKSDKKIDLSIMPEVAVDMRNKFENFHERVYKTHFNHVRDSVIVKALTGPWYLMFGVGKTGFRKDVKFTENPYYREHSPGERLRCYIPGEYKVSFQLKPKESIDVPFVFSGSFKSNTNLTKHFDKAYNGWQDLLKERIKEAENKETELYIETPDETINEGFSWARWSLNSLFHQSDTVSGIFAGYPWFLEYWARDSFLASFGLTSIDELEKTKTILNIFRRKGLPSKIETSGKMEFGFADTNPLFILASLHYYERTGDEIFKRSFDFALKNIVNDVKLENDLVSHDPKMTWMDTLERNFAIEVQALWSRIFRDYKKPYHQKIESKLNGLYWDEEETYYADSLKINSHPSISNLDTSNPLFHILFNETDEIRSIAVLEKIRTHFESSWGVSTWSRTAPNYSPDGYHNGSVWGMTTGIASCASFKYGDQRKGLDYLKNLALDVRRNTLGGMFETMSSDSGHLLGCGMQAWSMSMYLLAVTEYLFGIKYDSKNLTINLKPSIPEGWDKMKIIGKKIDNVPTDFIITSENDKIRIKIDAKSDYRKKIMCRLEMPGNVKIISANDSEIRKNIMTFPLERKNIIVCTMIK